jgi:septal ring factor EnvC (AmiA/AmiB activator)
MIRQLKFSASDLEHIAKIIEKRNRRIAPQQQITYSLEKCLNEWKQFVNDVEKGYSLTIYDYENDLSIRDDLAEIEIALSMEGRKTLMEFLKPLDDRFIAATQRVSKCVGLSPKYDWNWRVPTNPGTELLQDLQKEGLL